MAESADIVAYLYKNYARYTPPSELLQWTSNYVMKLFKPVFAWEAPLQAGLYKTGTSTTTGSFNEALQKAKDDIRAAIAADPVVVYTYDWSPFSTETLKLLDILGIQYRKISLGKEWIPGLINEGGSETRAALLEMTGQSSLPNIFIGGESIGGLYGGSPGLLALLEQGTLSEKVEDAKEKSVVAKEPPSVVIGNKRIVLPRGKALK